MAVYTPVSPQQAADFLRRFNLGAFKKITPIKAGIENSNFFITTESARYVLTLFEQRITETDLPWFMSVMQHLRHKGFLCAEPIADRSGVLIHRLNERPAVITGFLEGAELNVIKPAHCRHVGRVLGELHDKSMDFISMRANDLGPASWPDLLQKSCAAMTARYPFWQTRIRNVLAMVHNDWPKKLPSGLCHADLFIDNVFFINDQPSGVIDFYFACNDFYAYDLAITALDWCYQPANDRTSFRTNHAAELLAGYQTVRPLHDVERHYFNLLCCGAALRFIATRAYDLFNTPKDALLKMKDPMEYMHILMHLVDQRPFAKNAKLWEPG